MYEISTQISIEEIQDIIANNKQIKLSDDAKARIVKCRTYLDEKLANNEKPIYGINTGFGSLHSTKISNENLVQLQENLLLSHACGTGDLVPHEIIKIMLLLKVQSLAYGHAAAQLETVERLFYFFNNNILPVVFELGSLGASGDLAPLAHLSLPLIGEGNVYVKEYSTFKIQHSKLILEEHNLKPIALKSKEGLALINGTQFMSAYGVYCLIKANQLLTKTDFIASISIDAFDCRLEPLHLLHDVRPHKGQINTGQFSKLRNCKTT